MRNGPHVNFKLENARIPPDHLVGEEGHGIRVTATTLDHSRVDEGREIERYSSEAKLLATGVAVPASTQAIQICGASGCIETAPFARYMRDAKTDEIAGGSSEILKNTIGR